MSNAESVGNPIYNSNRLLDHPDNTIHRRVQQSRILHFDGDISTIATYKPTYKQEITCLIIQDTIGNDVLSGIPSVLEGFHDGWKYEVVEYDKGLPAVIRRFKHGATSAEQFANRALNSEGDSLDKVSTYATKLQRINLQYDNNKRLHSAVMTEEGKEIYTATHNYDNEGRLTHKTERIAADEDMEDSESLTFYSYKKEDDGTRITRATYERKSYRDMEVFFLNAEHVGLGRADNTTSGMSPVVRPLPFMDYSYGKSLDERSLYMSTYPPHAYKFIQHKLGRTITLPWVQPYRGDKPMVHEVTLPSYLIHEQLAAAKDGQLLELNEVPLHLKQQTMYLDEVIDSLENDTNIVSQFKLAVQIAKREIEASHVSPVNSSLLIDAALRLSKEGRISLMSVQIPLYLVQIFKGYMDSNQIKCMSQQFDQILDITPEDRSKYVQAVLLSGIQLTDEQRTILKLFSPNIDIQRVILDNLDILCPTQEDNN